MKSEAILHLKINGCLIKLIKRKGSVDWCMYIEKMFINIFCGSIRDVLQKCKKYMEGGYVEAR